MPTTDYKIGYLYGSRPVEKIAAFLLAMTAVIWFWADHKTVFSETTILGCIYGVTGGFVVRIFGASSMLEGTLWMLVTIVIWIKCGIAAAGMSVLGWLLFMFITLILMMSVTTMLRSGK